MPDEKDANHIPRLATLIQAKHKFKIGFGDTLYVFKDGFWQPNGEKVILVEVSGILSTGTIPWSSHKGHEVVEFVKLASDPLPQVLPVDYLNVRNGILDVKSRKLTPHSPEFLSTFRLPVKFDPNAKCPAWKKFIREVFQEDSQELAFEIVAWLMAPVTTIKKAMLLIGESDSGKSTFLRALISFIGEHNIAAKTLQFLENNRFSTAGLLGKLVNICADLPHNKLEKTDVFNAITGNDLIQGEFKGGRIFEFHATSRLVFSSNKFPFSSDTTEAFYDRWYVQQMPHRFKKDPEMAKHLDRVLSDPEEQSGVLNEALNVFPKVIKYGLTSTPSMDIMSRRHRAITDVLGSWIRNNIAVNPEGFIPCTPLKNQADEDLFGVDINSTIFGRTIREIFPQVEREKKSVNGSMTWCYLGIKWIGKAITIQ